MKKTGSILFISDLHLEKDRPAITQEFLSLLGKLDRNIDALYILGDLFETWIGDDCDLAAHRDIIDGLKTVTNKDIPVYFLHGNRDFLVGQEFCSETGCIMIQDETLIDVYGELVLLMHGDTLCTRDIAYIKARKLIRNPVLQSFFLFLPQMLRKKIADKLRQKSKQHTTSTASEIMDVTQEEVEKIMVKHGVKYLIHGHTHRPCFHEFTLQNQLAQRIVLGAWHDRCNALIWHANGRKEMIDNT